MGLLLCGYMSRRLFCDFCGYFAELTEDGVFCYADEAEPFYEDFAKLVEREILLVLGVVPRRMLTKHQEPTLVVVLDERQGDVVNLGNAATDDRG